VAILDLDVALFVYIRFRGRYDVRQNDIQYNDSWRESKNMMLSIMALTTELHFYESHLRYVLFMLSVPTKHIMLSIFPRAVLPNVNMLSVFILSDFILSVFILSDFILSVFILSDFILSVIILCYILSCYSLLYSECRYAEC
jgi:hypothetical protein